MSAKDSKPRSFKESKKEGAPKKGGGGGKGTWGKPSDDAKMSVDSLNPDDPNYDEEEDGVVFDSYTPLLTPEQFKAQIAPLIREYFENGDSKEFIKSVQKFEYGNKWGECIVSLINHSLEKKDDARELASKLIRDIMVAYPDDNVISEAFTTILNNLQDLSIDIPDVSVLMSKFIGRAINDNVLPSDFPENNNSNQNEAAVDAAKGASAWLKRKHIWGVGVQNTVSELDREISDIIQEFLSSDDCSEAISSIKNLNVPHYHHQVVFTALALGAEETPKSDEKVFKLLKNLLNASILSSEQFNAGLERVFHDINDISLDAPNVFDFVQKFCSKAKDEKMISEETFNQVPTKGRKHKLSENGH